MSDIRRPCFIFLLKTDGKKKHEKVEIFNANLWKSGAVYRKRCKTSRYRLRVNGKWFSNKKTLQKYFNKTEIRDMLWKSIYF